MPKRNMDAKPRTYYDHFSKVYERGRDRGYHALIDDIESDAVSDVSSGGLALDAGCGTGLVMARLMDRKQEVIDNLATGAEVTQRKMGR